MMEKAKMKVRIGNLFDLWAQSSKLEQTGKVLDQLFAYVLALNVEAIVAHVRGFKKSVRADKGYQEYEAQVEELNKKFALQREGKPLKRDGHYLIGDIQGLEAGIMLLQEESEAFQKREKFLMEEVEVEFHLIKSRYLPENIDLSLMKAIRHFVVQDNEFVNFKCPECEVAFKREEKGSEWVVVSRPDKKKD